VQALALPLVRAASFLISCSRVGGGSRSTFSTFRRACATSPEEELDRIQAPRVTSPRARPSSATTSPRLDRRSVINRSNPIAASMDAKREK